MPTAVGAYVSFGGGVGVCLQLRAGGALMCLFGPSCNRMKTASHPCTCIMRWTGIMHEYKQQVEDNVFARDLYGL